MSDPDRQTQRLAAAFLATAQDLEAIRYHLERIASQLRRTAAVVNTGPEAAVDLELTVLESRADDAFDAPPP